MNITPEISGTLGETFTQPPHLPRGGKVFCLRGAHRHTHTHTAEAGEG